MLELFSIYHPLVNLIKIILIQRKSSPSRSQKTHILEGRGGRRYQTSQDIEVAKHEYDGPMALEVLDALIRISYC